MNFAGVDVVHVDESLDIINKISYNEKKVNKSEVGNDKI